MIFGNGLLQNCDRPWACFYYPIKDYLKPSTVVERMWEIEDFSMKITENLPGITKAFYFQVQGDTLKD